MTGIDSYSVTPATNATADGGAINWSEGQAPSSVNNTARQMLADVRARENDLIWFQYGTGDQGAGNLAVPAVYSSGTGFTIAGADVTAAYHVGRRLRAVGVSTGTIYGRISVTSYAPATTTVTAVWDSGSLSNETLVISLSQIPVTGAPVTRVAGPWTATGIITGSSFTDGGSASGYATSGGGVTVNYQTQINIVGGQFNVVNTSNGVALTVGASAWAAISDETLKTPFIPFSNPLEKVCAIKSGTGRYLTDGKTVSRSFLSAQSVQAVLPEAVSARDEDGKLMLAYTDVIPLLVAALAEAKVRIEALESI